MSREGPGRALSGKFPAPLQENVFSKRAPGAYFDRLASDFLPPLSHETPSAENRGESPPELSHEMLPTPLHTHPVPPPDPQGKSKREPSSGGAFGKNLWLV